MLKKLVTAALVFAIFTGGAFAAFQVAEESQNAAAQGTQNVTGESLVLQTGVYQFVDKATVDSTAGFANDSVTVRNSSGVELTRGTDYEWNSTDGSVIVFNTSSVTDGASGEIDYQYQRNTQEVQTVARPLSALTEAIGLLPIAAAGFGLVITVIGFGTAVGKFFGSDGPGGNR